MIKMFDEGVRMDRATGIQEFGEGRLLTTVLRGSGGRVGLMVDKVTGDCWVEADPGELVAVQPVDPITALCKLRELGVECDWIQPAKHGPFLPFPKVTEC